MTLNYRVYTRLTSVTIVNMGKLKIPSARNVYCLGENLGYLNELRKSAGVFWPARPPELHSSNLTTPVILVIIRLAKIGPYGLATAMGLDLVL